MLLGKHSIAMVQDPKKHKFLVGSLVCLYLMFFGVPLPHVLWCASTSCSLVCLYLMFFGVPLPHVQCTVGVCLTLMCCAWLGRVQEATFVACAMQGTWDQSCMGDFFTQQLHLAVALVTIGVGPGVLGAGACAAGVDGGGQWEGVGWVLGWCTCC
jgi:hypothetical protein